MPHNLTEGNTFANDGTLAVPEGTDDHHNLSSYIEFIAQTLADRSQYLKLRADDAAQRGGNNLFTGNNTFAGVFQTGDATIAGTLAVNADTTLGADGTGNLQVNGTIGSTGDITAGTDGSGNLTVNGTMGVSGTAVFGASIAGGGDIAIPSANRFGYLGGGPTRTKRLNLATGNATDSLVYVGASGWGKDPTGAIQYLEVPILLPHGSTLTALTALVSQTVAALVFNVFRINQTSWLGGSPSTSSNVGNPNLSNPNLTGAVVAVALTGLGGGHVIDNVNNEYHLRVEWPSAAGTTDAFLAALVTFTDPGPRND